MASPRQDSGLDLLPRLMQEIAFASQQSKPSTQRGPHRSTGGGTVPRSILANAVRQHTQTVPGRDHSIGTFSVPVPHRGSRSCAASPASVVPPTHYSSSRHRPAPSNVSSVHSMSAHEQPVPALAYPAPRPVFHNEGLSALRHRDPGGRPRGSPRSLSTSSTAGSAGSSGATFNALQVAQAHAMHTVQVIRGHLRRGDGEGTPTNRQLSNALRKLDTDGSGVVSVADFQRGT